jgi:chemotaxis protein methyltransferase CheR
VDKVAQAGSEEPIPPGMINHLLSHAGAAPAAKPSKRGGAAGSPVPLAEENESEADLWEEGLRLFAEEKFEEAGASFERMLAAFPHSPQAHLGLGLLHANRGAEDRSREYAEKAKSHDDLLPEIYFLLALLDERGGDLVRAIQNYQRVILLHHDFAMAHFNLGNVYLKQGRERDANREFGNTIAILERDLDNHSLRFSGGLSREAVISFCRMQREAASGPAPRRARAN